MDRASAELNAINLHSKGDLFYNSQMFTLAYAQFTNSIQATKNIRNNKREKNLSILYAKRSLTCLKMSQFKKCLEDVQCALKLKSDSEKINQIELKRLRQAIIQNVLKTDVNVS